MEDPKDPELAVNGMEMFEAVDADSGEVGEVGEMGGVVDSPAETYITPQSPHPAPPTQSPQIPIQPGAPHSKWRRSSLRTSLLPSHTAPPGTRRCRLCPSLKIPIGGDGPQPSPILFVGEAPGPQEDRRRAPSGHGRCFIGDSGVELRELYLPLAGLKDTRVRICNLVHCIPHVEGGNPTPSLAKCCSDEWMLQEINLTEPSVIVTLGAIPYRTLFPTAPPLKRQHGRPVHLTYKSWSGMVVPMYHPAAGMRRDDIMVDLIQDFRRLRRILAGTYTAPTDPYPHPQYWEVTSPYQLQSYLESPDSLAVTRGVLASDTETEPVDVPIVGPDGKPKGVRQKDVPFCMSLSVSPGTGVVIRASNHDTLSALNSWLKSTGATMILHNQPFDVQVEEQMGVTIPRGERVERFDDTMSTAYHLQDTPRSLKAAAARLLGARMSEFEDVVRPPSTRLMLEWMRGALTKLDAPKAVPMTKVADSPHPPLEAIANPYHHSTHLTLKTVGRGAGKRQVEVEKPWSVTERKKAYREALEVMVESGDATMDDIIRWRQQGALGGVVALEGEDEYLSTFIGWLNSYKTGNEKAASTLRRTVKKLEEVVAGWGSEDEAVEVDGEDEEGEAEGEDESGGGSEGGDGDEDDSSPTTSSPTDPWKLLRDWRLRDQERGTNIVPTIITAAGSPPPKLSIRNVPWPKALHYSARDADITLRFWLVLRRLRANRWAQLTGDRIVEVV